MDEAVVVAYSNAEEARLLQIPRTKLCTGQGRCFPGSLHCSQFSSGRCRFRIGCIAIGASSQNSEGAVKDSRGVDHFATWESTKNTDLWKRFEKHLRKCHFFGTGSKLVVHCPKCPVTFTNSKDLFEHCFGLLESGLFCRLCRYPFDPNGNPSCIYLHCRNHHIRKVDRPYNWTITSFADFVAGGNLEITTKDVLSHNLEIVKCRRLPTVDDGCGLSGLQNLLQIDASPCVPHSAERRPSGAASSEAKFSKESSKPGKFVGDLPDNRDSFYFDSSLRKIVCSRCNKLYPNKLAVKSHIMNSHVERKCRNCSKVFSSWSWYIVHNRECLVKKKPDVFDKSVAARNGTIRSILSTKFNSERYSNLIANDVKPAKRAKLMSNLDTPELHESFKLPQSADDFLQPSTYDYVPCGLFKEPIDLKPSITVNECVNRYKFDQNTGNDSSGLPINLKLEPTLGTSEEPIQTSFSVKQDQKFPPSLDLIDPKDVKLEPLDP